MSKDTGRFADNKPDDKDKKKGGKKDKKPDLAQSTTSMDSYDADEDFTKPPAAAWKPAKHVSYETMGLCKTADNPVMRPCGFRKDGQLRKIKDTCLIARMRNICILKDKSQPKLAVCITMYNENERELRFTLRGLIQNYNILHTDPAVKMGQQDMVVCCVCDGYDQIPQSFKDYAAKYQFFDIEKLKLRGFMKENKDNKWVMKTMGELMPTVDEKELPKNCLHLFQVCTWDFGLEEDSLKGRRINFIFAIKQRNDGKINSHKWFFQGIAKYLQPNNCLMLDIGTKANDYAIAKLYKYMGLQPKCGGTCGEIEVDLDEYMSFSKYAIRAMQYYEYKLAHSPDKLMESFFGFNSVLPGAYCMFRWAAIQGGPMDQFFKLVNKTTEPTCREANEYLAEDRVMCLQIFIKEKSGWFLTFIPDAKAVTDAPDRLLVLMKQRRRWMNGSLFAATRVLGNMSSMVGCGRKTKQPIYRRIGVFFLMCYYILNQVWSFMIIGTFYLAVKVFSQSMMLSLTEYGGIFYGIKSDYKTFFENGGDFSKLLSVFWGGMVVVCLVCSLAAPLDKAMIYFKITAGCFSVVNTIAYIGIFTQLIDSGPTPSMLIKDPTSGDWHQVYYVDAAGVPEPIHHISPLFFVGFIMFGVFFAPMYMRPKDFLHNAGKYLYGFLVWFLMLPCYINIFSIYAFSNLHDISWGNRPAAADTEQMASNAKKAAKLLDNYKVFRINVVAVWLMINILYVILVQAFENKPLNIANNGQLYWIDYLGLLMAIMVLFRLIFGWLYLCKFKCKVNCGDKYRIEERDLLREFKKMKKGEFTDLEDSGMLAESLVKNDNGDDDDDNLVATLSPLEMKMKKMQLLKKEKENKRNGLEETGFVNVDNDDEEFASAEDEVLEDLEEHEKTKMLKPDASGFMFDFLRANDRNKDELGQSRSQTYYAKLEKRQSMHAANPNLEKSAGMFTGGAGGGFADLVKTNSKDNSMYGGGNGYRTGGGKSVHFAAPSENDSQLTDSVSVAGISNASKQVQEEIKDAQDQSTAQQTLMYKASDKPQKLDNADFDFE